MSGTSIIAKFSMSLRTKKPLSWPFSGRRAWTPPPPRQKFFDPRMDIVSHSIFWAAFLGEHNMHC